MSRLLTVMAVLFALAIVAPFAVAGGHHDLNGTWTLVPDKSDFGGQSAIQTGTLTIWDREHHIYVSRTFAYDGSAGTISYNFSEDGGENSTIHAGKSVKSKAKWDGNVLKVTTTEDGVETIERYNLAPDGTLTLTVERPSRSPMTMAFVRQ